MNMANAINEIKNFRSFFLVIPLGLHIPVGWRQPSYKS